MPCHTPPNDIVAKFAAPMDLQGKPLVITRTHRQGAEPARDLTTHAVGMAVGRSPMNIHNDFASGRLEGIEHGDYIYKPRTPEGNKPLNLEPMKQMARNAGLNPDHDMTDQHKDEESRGSGDDRVKMSEKEYGAGSASLFKPRRHGDPPATPRDVHAPAASKEAIEGVLGRGTTNPTQGKSQVPIRKAADAAKDEEPLNQMGGVHVDAGHATVIKKAQEEVGDWTTRPSPAQQLEMAHRIRRKKTKAPKNLDTIIAAHLAKRQPPAAEEDNEND